LLKVPKVKFEVKNPELMLDKSIGMAGLRMEKVCYILKSLPKNYSVPKANGNKSFAEEKIIVRLF